MNVFGTVFGTPTDVFGLVFQAPVVSAGFVCLKDTAINRAEGIATLATAKATATLVQPTATATIKTCG